VAAVEVRQRIAEPELVALPQVAIRSLGAFVVEREGEVVPAAAWQSKKARDVLKLLLCCRGRPATREALIEALWPEQDPRRTSNRLSVALSTARAVLDPDHRLASDYFICANRYAIRLECDKLDIDVERFLGAARAGLCLLRAGQHAAAAGQLLAAEAAYTGDFLEEDLYEDWAFSLREEAHANYVAVAGALALLADANGDHEEAIRLRVRVLERDPYDEAAHLALIASHEAAGHHGHAHRAHRRYAERMHEIGVVPRRPTEGRAGALRPL
jgi:DNA-binding SARP family transcriptional activator